MRRFSPLFALLLVCACSTKKDGAPPDPLADRDGFCAEWGNRVCNDKVAEACVVEKADCVTAQTKYCEGQVPDGKYSEKSADTCLSAVAAAYADGVLDTDDLVLVAFGNECAKIISGSSGKDGACSESSDCDRDQDLECVKKSGEADGKCEVPVPASGGKSCSAEDAVCEDGFYCDSGNHCIAAGVEGDTCSADAPCDPAFRCDASSVTDGGTSSATCVALVAVKGDCKEDAECASHICVVNATTRNGKCTDKITLAASEAVCADLQ